MKHAALFLLAAALQAQVTDFTLTAGGPHHVVQGYPVTFNVKSAVLAGTDTVSGITPSVSGLPAGATVSFPNMVRYCCGTTLYRLGPDSNPIRISTSSATPIGTFPLQISYTTAGGVTRSTTWTITVDPVPAAIVPVVPSAPPPLTMLPQWTAAAAKYGALHCTAAETATWAESTVAYYDGTRVYYNLADMPGFNAATWNPCAAMVEAAYATYVNNAGGHIPGYHVFPLGLALKFQRTADVAARQTLTSILANSPYTLWPDASYVVDWSVSREISYAIEANLVDQSLGGTPNPHFQDLVETLFGHFDQWFVSKNAPFAQPFMVPLGAEALIAYYDKTGDVRVPPMLQLAADQIWANSWSAACQCFGYFQDDITQPGYGTSSAASNDLNGLIAPLYGWVFKQTGLEKYRTEGDQIFNATMGSDNGVSNGTVVGVWLDGGKQFSQTYRWSWKYVEWTGRTVSAGSGGTTGGTGTTTTQTLFSLLANAGGPAIGNYTAGAACPGSTAYGPANQASLGTVTGIWQTLIYGNSFTCSYTVPNGLYLVTLDLEEPNVTKKGQRLFTITTQPMTPDAMTTDSLDLFALAGGTLKPYPRPIPVAVNNGMLTLLFKSRVNHALVNGIEIHQVQ